MTSNCVWLNPQSVNGTEQKKKKQNPPKKDRHKGLHTEPFLAVSVAMSVGWFRCSAKLHMLHALHQFPSLGMAMEWLGRGGGVNRHDQLISAPSVSQSVSARAIKVNRLLFFFALFAFDFFFFLFRLERPSFCGKRSRKYPLEKLSAPRWLG